MDLKTRSPFIAKLINKVSRFYWFIVRPETRGVKAIISNSEDKILLVRLTYYPNTWTFPGGGVDKKETSEEAVKRELKEELDLDLINPKFIDNLFFTFEYKKDTVSVFTENVGSPDIKVDQKEVAEFDWFSLDNLPNMGNNAKKFLDLYLNNR